MIGTIDRLPSCRFDQIILFAFFYPIVLPVDSCAYRLNPPEEEQEENPISILHARPICPFFFFAFFNSVLFECWRIIAQSD